MTLLALAIAVIGLVIGLVALYVAVSADHRAHATAADLRNLAGTVGRNARPKPQQATSARLPPPGSRPTPRPRPET